MAYAKRRYAVAVRGGKLHPLLYIVRSPKGDVCIVFPIPGWDLHSIYHASGERHDKTDGRSFSAR